MQSFGLYVFSASMQSEEDFFAKPQPASLLTNEAFVSRFTSGQLSYMDPDKLYYCGKLDRLLVDKSTLLAHFSWSAISLDQGKTWRADAMMEVELDISNFWVTRTRPHVFGFCLEPDIADKQPSRINPILLYEPGYDLLDRSCVIYPRSRKRPSP